jgi:peroxiredoxin
MVLNMVAPEFSAPLVPGAVAPNFELPRIDGTGTVSLSDYRGRSPLFLAIFIGLWCPFCRRAIAQIALSEPTLKEAGVETLGVVATTPENAALYFRYRPARISLAADPELSTHKAYGVPKPVPTPELMDEMAATWINPHGIFSEPLPIPEAAAAAARLDGYQETATDRSDMEKQWPQLKGQFFIDRDCVVRWASIEAEEGLSGVGNFPTSVEIMRAARTVA